MISWVNHYCSSARSVPLLFSHSSLHPWPLCVQSQNASGHSCNSSRSTGLDEIRELMQSSLHSRRAHPPCPAVARDQRSWSTRQQWRGCECVQELCRRLCVLGQDVVSIPSTTEKINMCWSALTPRASAPMPVKSLRLSGKGKSWNREQKSKSLRGWINVDWG